MTGTPTPEEKAHDILAAEAFAVPGPDPVLHQVDASRLPLDPSGIPEAHDVLAAEEFAIPAPPGRMGRDPSVTAVRSSWSKLGAVAAAAAGLLGAVLLRGRRGR
jgi:hypothetical protein